MADFCSQCSMQHFRKDFRDLADLGPPPKKGYGYEALCEGCGPTLVDDNGVCIFPGCKEHADALC